MGIKKKGNIDHLVGLAREYGQDIESALKAVKNSDVRAAMAGAVMNRVLAAEQGNCAPIPQSGKRSLGRRLGRGGDDGGGVVGLKGTQARIMELSDEGFFDEPRSVDQVREELGVKGYHYNRADMTMSLLRLARKKKLRRISVFNGKRKSFSYVKI